LFANIGEREERRKGGRRKGENEKAKIFGLGFFNAER
jgi:hypothetical protein